MSTLEEKEKELAILSNRIHKMRIKLTYLEEERRKLKIEYESLDRRQAMTDARFKKIQNPTKKQIKPKEEIHPKDMTLEQIHELAKKLGVKLG